MAITGSEKQEEKIVFLKTIAEEMFPDLPADTFDKAIRSGIETALKEHHYKEWSDVAREQPLARKTFFETALNASKNQLQQTGLSKNQIDNLVRKLDKKNRRYLG